MKPPATLWPRNCARKAIWRWLDAPELVAIYFNSRTSRRDHVAFYRCTVRQVTPKLPDREILESGFFALDALPEGITPATKRRLAELGGELPFRDIW